MKPEEVIRNSELIIKIYGRWPSFHDFEITKVIFERNIDTAEVGPFISIFIHMWEVTGKSPDGKRFIFGKHNIAEIRCNSVSEYEFKWFNSQNVIDDIDMREEERGKNKVFSIHFPNIHGADLLIKCSSIEVVSVKPDIPKHSVYSEK